LTSERCSAARNSLDVVLYLAAPGQQTIQVAELLVSARLNRPLDRLDTHRPGLHEIGARKASM
jgi:hypothetical protein